MRYALRISLFLALILHVACGSKQQHGDGVEHENMPEELVAELTIGATSEVLVELGAVAPRSITTRDIRIVNTTDAPIVLLDYETTCRCTTLDFPRTPIAAGGEVVAVLSFDSRGEWGGIGNFLSIETSNEECAVVVWMSAEVY